MRVQLRIAGARRAVTERRRDQTVSRLNASTAMAPAHRGRGALEVPDGFLHRPIVRLTNRRPQIATAEAKEHTDALRRRERQIEPGNPYRARRRSQRHSVSRVQPGEDVTQCLARYLAGQT